MKRESFADARDYSESDLAAVPLPPPLKGPTELLESPADFLASLTFFFIPSSAVLPALEAATTFPVLVSTTAFVPSPPPAIEGAMASITAVALSTTFTPPASCAEQRLTLAPPKYEIWMNDPQPVEGSRVSDCYPSQWIEQYTSSMGASTYTAPMMSPFVCPSAWTAVATSYANLPDYIACCPKSYGLTPPKETKDPKRPAYGGTCYSPLASGSTYIVTKYDTRSVEGTIEWPATTVTDNAYAHPIDGYRVGAVVTSTGSSGTVVIAPTGSTTLTSGATNTNTANGADADSNTGASLSGGAIAGIVIGVVGGLALVAVAVFLLFRRRRQHAAAGRPTTASTAGAAALPATEKPDPDVYEAPESPHPHPAGELYGQHNPSELHNHHYVAELGPGERAELPSNYHGAELR